MLSIPTTTQLTAIRDAYSNMARCDETVVLSFDLNGFPKKPIDVHNKRFAKGQSRVIKRKKRNVIETLTLPAKFFKDMEDAKGEATVELSDEGLAVVTFEKDTPLKTDGEIALDKFLEDADQSVVERFAGVLPDYDACIDMMEFDGDDDFLNEYFKRFGDLSDEEVENVLRHRRLGKFKDGDEKSSVAFYPTVVDLVRMHMERGIEEIPTALLARADEIDDDPTEFILESEEEGGRPKEDAPKADGERPKVSAKGCRLAEMVLDSYHGWDTFRNSKKNRTGVIEHDLHRDLGNPVFIFTKGIDGDRKEAPTIITEKGIIVGFSSNFRVVKTCYFASPTDVVKSVIGAASLESVEPWGSSHPRSSIPTRLLYNSILNAVNGWVGLDNDDSVWKKQGTRRYIEAKD